MHHVLDAGYPASMLRRERRSAMLPTDASARTPTTLQPAQGWKAARSRGGIASQTSPTAVFLHTQVTATSTWQLPPSLSSKQRRMGEAERRARAERWGGAEGEGGERLARGDMVRRGGEIKAERERLKKKGESFLLGNESYYNGSSRAGGQTYNEHVQRKENQRNMSDSFPWSQPFNLNYGWMTGRLCHVSIHCYCDLSDRAGREYARM
ncbi:hypothetical protein INR49_003439 [Caranx melampygus]|nr:hypothetical protein INR49_003439 [Caranx melampygus]